MLYAADTNILLRIAEPGHTMHVETLRALAVLRSGGDMICTFPQNVIEFWNVATRPVDKNGLGLTPPQAHAEIEKIEKIFQLILDTPEIYTEWKRLVFMHSVSGKQVHDARIAAAMKAHGITHLLTFNKDDFKRFSHVTAVSPAEVKPSSTPLT